MGTTNEMVAELESKGYIIKKRDAICGCVSFIIHFYRLTINLRSPQLPDLSLQRKHSVRTGSRAE